MFCLSRGSQGERRGGHLQRGPFRGGGRAGRRKESPDCWAAAGCCGPPAQSVPPDLAPPAPAAVPFLFTPLPFFLLPSSSSGNLPAETHRSLMPRQGQSPTRQRPVRASSHAPHPTLLSNLRTPAFRSLASPARRLSFFVPFRVDGDPLSPTKPSLHKATRRLQLQNWPLGICSNRAGFPPGSRN